ncbi:4Fe-4S binding protein [Photobacterium sanguinicancri]
MNDPDICIGCSLCAPECTADAIFQNTEIPPD